MKKGSKSVSPPPSVWMTVWKELQCNYLAEVSSPLNYSNKVRLIDCFLVYLTFIGAMQMAYVMIVGTFPFNSFLAAFTAAVGTFVLTLALRLQITNPAIFGLFRERAFAEYLICILALYIAVFTYIG